MSYLRGGKSYGKTIKNISNNFHEINNKAWNSLTSIYYRDMDYDKTFVYSKILCYDNEYYKSEAIKFLLALENINYERAIQYLNNNVRR
ncbi:hypothetical protein [Brachyspira aalborgi]|uniref:Uncharacterized protein n=1 Tax=Brachyspira aalborgi TaxID=29522 RepID=A0A5C8G5M4_9SPIR|nr:hypothetical protein [Brachyspira aalborgi]TXJ57146.1 hypothetical protein EPJ76_03430 [Brachyspira aalborgi]